MCDREERTEAELVEATLEGDDEAFGEIVTRHQDELFRHAVRMVGEGEAEDLVQEAFVRAYRRLEDCRHPERVGGWLFRIVSSICKDHLKTPRESRPKVPLDADTSPPLMDGASGADVGASRSFLRDDLEEALGTLAPEKREAFLMKHLEGYTYREMAALLDDSVPALKMRVHRARLQLQEHLAGYQERSLDIGPSRPSPTTGPALATAMG